MDYKSRVKLGRLSSGEEKDRGTIYHACDESVGTYSFNQAICGAKPRAKSAGWSESQEQPINCEKCLEKLINENQIEAEEQMKKSKFICGWCLKGHQETPKECAEYNELMSLATKEFEVWVILRMIERLGLKSLKHWKKLAPKFR